MNNKIKILIVEDDIFYLKMVKRHVNNLKRAVFPKQSFEILTSSTADDCMEKLDKDTTIVIMDYYLENDQGEVVFPGIYLLQAINLFCDDCKVIVVSGQQSKQIAINLIKTGIYEYIVKDKDTFIRLASTLDKIIKSINSKKYLQTTEKGTSGLNS